MFLDVTLSGAQEFIEECNITNGFDHPNVLSLIGVSINPERGIPLMIMPFMNNGDVKSFVKSKRGNSIECDCFPEVGLFYKTVKLYHSVTDMYIAFKCICIITCYMHVIFLILAINYRTTPE